jgi:aminodeoxyfutalosine synthase
VTEFGRILASDRNASITLPSIEDKVLAGERLSFDEGMFLEEQVDTLTLGRLANIVRERKNGNFAYYNTNIHLNPTNVCVYRCTFCAFRSDLKSERSYVFSDDMVRERVWKPRRAARRRSTSSAGCTI